MEIEDCDDDEIEIYTDSYVLDELERLSMHTCDEVQSRIQEVFMWLYRHQRGGKV